MTQFLICYPAKDIEHKRLFYHSFGVCVWSEHKAMRFDTRLRAAKIAREYPRHDESHLPARVIEWRSGKRLSAKSHSFRWWKEKREKNRERLIGTATEPEYPTIGLAEIPRR